MILSDLLKQMINHHIATDRDPVPGQVGISYVWAGNGTWRYAKNVDTEVIVSWRPGYTPGLPDLNPAIAWEHWSGRLPGALLVQALAEARLAQAPKGHGEDAAAMVPIEVQWLAVLDAECQPRLIQPPQTASPGQVRYELEHGQSYLLDIHSHHTMPPFFSRTDDADDTWLSASVVIGDIFGTPTLLCRLNVYGAHQTVPALTIFDDLGPFADLSMAPETDADPPPGPGDPNDPWTSVDELIRWLVEAMADAGIQPATDDAAAAELLKRLDAAIVVEAGLTNLVAQGGEGDDAPPAA